MLERDMANAENARLRSSIQDLVEKWRAMEQEGGDEEERYLVVGAHLAANELESLLGEPERSE